MLLFHCLHSVNNTSVSLSEGFLLLILHQTGIPAGKSADPQEMQLTTRLYRRPGSFHPFLVFIKLLSEFSAWLIKYEEHFSYSLEMSQESFSSWLQDLTFDCETLLFAQ